MFSIGKCISFLKFAAIGAFEGKIRMSADLGNSGQNDSRKSVEKYLILATNRILNW